MRAGLWVSRILLRPGTAGRSFANDDDLIEQAAGWLQSAANMRWHATSEERPVDRFERDERVALHPLASCPYLAPWRQPGTGTGACPGLQQGSSAARSASMRRRCNESSSARPKADSVR